MKLIRFRILPRLLNARKGIFSSVKKEYFDGYLYPKHYTHFDEIFQHLRETDHSSTSRDIRFLDLDFGASRRKAKAMFGEPSYRKVLPCPRNFKYNVYFYFMKLGSYRTLAQLHFLNNKFFYGHINFSSDNPVRKSDIQMIKDIVYSKYIGETNEVTQIIDSDNNRLYIENSVNFTINYLTGSEEVANQLFDICNNNHEKSVKRVTSTKKILEDAL